MVSSGLGNYCLWELLHGLISPDMDSRIVKFVDVQQNGIGSLC